MVSFVRALFAVLLLAPAVTAQQTPDNVPHIVKFAGTVANADGSPRTGVVSAMFALYAEQQGGTALWTELHNVQLDQEGRYSILLGSEHEEGLPAELFTATEARWLGVQVEADAEQPRVLLVSVPYALKAADAETLQGFTVEQILGAGSRVSLTSEEASTQAPNTSINLGRPGRGAVPPNGSAPAPGPHVQLRMNSTPSGVVEARDDSNNTPLLLLLNPAGGNVGIGVTNPGQRLSVAGVIESIAGGYKFPDATVQTTAVPTCANGQVPLWSALAWTCAAVPGVGTVTSIVAGTGLTGGTITTTGTIAVDTTKVPLLGSANTFTTSQTISGGFLTVNSNSNGVIAVNVSSGGPAAVFNTTGNGKIFIAQNNGLEKFSVDANGNITVAGSITGTFNGTLAGDVSGTQSATVVGKIQGISVLGGTPAGGSSLIYNAGTFRWEPGVPGVAAGFSGSLAGDVTGTQAATTVGKLQGVPIANTAPGLNQLLAFDGTQWKPSFVSGTVLPYLSRNATDTSSVNIATTGGQLYSLTQSNTTAASADRSVLKLTDSTTTPGGHDFLLIGNTPQTFSVTSGGKVTASAFAGDGSALTGITFNGTLAGDVTGATNLTTVGKIQGVTVAPTAPNDGQLLAFKAANSRWEPATISSVSTFSGNLAGDVTGTQSTTLVGKIQGVTVAPTAPSNGQSLVFNTTNLRWEPATIGSVPSFSGNLAGDVTGTQSTTLVGKIQGVTVAPTAPSNGQSLVFNTTNLRWEPTTIGSVSSFSGNLSGDVTGTQSNTTIAKIRGTPVGTGAPTAGQSLVFNGTTWAPAAVSNAGTSVNFTGVLSGDVTGNQATTQVVGIQGHPVAGTAPSSGQLLSFDGAQWKPSFVSGTTLPYLNRDASDTSTANVATSGGQLYSFTQSNTTTATSDRSVLKLTDSTASPGGHDYLLIGQNPATFSVSSTGQVKASGFVGDGSGLTNVPVGSVSGAITSVTAGSGMMGGGSTGNVTLSVRTDCQDSQMLRWTQSSWKCWYDGFYVGDGLYGYYDGPYLNELTVDSTVARRYLPNDFYDVQTIHGNNLYYGAVPLDIQNWAGNPGMQLESPYNSSGGSPTLMFKSSAMNDVGNLNSNWFYWQAQPVNEFTPNPSNKLSLWTGTQCCIPTTETGFSFNADGTVNFAAGQVFPSIATLSSANNFSGQNVFSGVPTGPTAQEASVLINSSATSGSLLAAIAGGNTELLLDSTGNLTLGGGLYLPGAPSGGIWVGGNRFLHNSGTDSTFLGNGAGVSQFSFRNTAVGASALQNLSVNPSDNVAVGFTALQALNNGPRNIGIGSQAMYQMSIGSDNVAIGQRALNATGGVVNGQFSVFDNVVIGSYAMGGSVSGTGMQNGNVAIGGSALYNSTGAQNIAVGESAGYSVTTGSNNILIGNNGTASDTGITRIGNNLTAKAFIAGIRGVTTGVNNGATVLIDANGQLGTVNSSRRYKEDIRDLANGSRSIFDLRPVTFRYRKPFDDGSKPVQFGLIAEEVAEVFPELVIYNDDGQPETVKYHLLPVLMLNEMKKQQKEVERLRGLESKLAALQAENEKLRAIAETSRAAQRELEVRLARIEQAMGSVVAEKRQQP